MNIDTIIIVSIYAYGECMHVGYFYMPSYSYIYGVASYACKHGGILQQHACSYIQLAIAGTRD